MHNLHTLLSKLGFQHKEIQIYLTLQSIGSQPASIVAEKTGINRVTSYTLLQKLSDKGVVQTIKRGNIQYFSTGETDALVHFANRKHEELKIVSQELNKSLSRIPEGQAYAAPSLFAKVYSGLEGTKSFLYEMLSAEHVVLCTSLHSPEYTHFLTEILFPRLRRKEYIKGEIYVHSFLFEKVAALFDGTSIQVMPIYELTENMNFCITDHHTLGLLSEERNILQALKIENSGITASFKNCFYRVQKPKDIALESFTLREKSNESYEAPEDTK